MQQNLPGALLSVWGTSGSDVYAVGADAKDGQGPLVLHFDGKSYQRLNTGATGDLWWNFAVNKSQHYMVGTNGLILQYDQTSNTFTKMATPRSDVTLFGIWGSVPTDLWAVGGDVDNKGGPTSVAWHYDGTSWKDFPLPAAAVSTGFTPFKVWGTGIDDVWICGSEGMLLHFNGTTWAQVPTGTTVRLVTVHGSGRLVEAVGGLGDSTLVESPTGSSFSVVPGPRIQGLNGVFMTTETDGIAVGNGGFYITRNSAGWTDPPQQAPTTQDFHAVWVDPTGGIWAVGGHILSAPLINGVLLHQPPPPPVANAGCVPTPGTICTFAGTGQAGFNGDGQALTGSYLYFPMDINFDANNTGYVLDWNNHRIRQITAQRTFKTVVGTDFVGDGPPDFSDKKSPGAAGTTVNLNHPTDVQFDANGLMIIATWHNHKIRTWNPQTGLVRILAGAGFGFSGDGGPAVSALLNQPSKVRLDPAGNIYVLDMRNQRIRKIANDAQRTITTVAGTGVKGFNGDGKAPLATQFSFPTGPNPLVGGGLVLDSKGNLYISDTENNRVRYLDFAANTVTTVAGTGVKGFSGDEGPATAAQLSDPRDIELGPDGNLYIVDSSNNRIRFIDLKTGLIHTIAGNGTMGFSGDNGPAKDASLNLPYGIGFDRNGNLYIADTFNNRIREVAQ